MSDVSLNGSAGLCPREDAGLRPHAIDLSIADKVIARVLTVIVALKDLRGSEEVQAILSEGECAVDLVKQSADSITQFGLLCFQAYEKYFAPSTRAVSEDLKLEQLQTRDDVLDYIVARI